MTFAFFFVLGCRKRKINLDVNVMRCVDATPRKKYLFKAYQAINKQMLRSKRTLTNFKERIAMAEKLLDLGLNKLPSSAAARFFSCQITESQKGKKAHRFTIDEKIFALALCKRSGRAYKFLSEFFVLPARSTLNRLIQGLNLYPGINDKMFQNLKNVVQNMKVIDRHCILLFDEMALSPSLSYNEHLGLIEGFENLGCGKTSLKFAD